MLCTSLDVRDVMICLTTAVVVMNMRCRINVNKKSILQLHAADLPSTWTYDDIKFMRFKTIEWSFDTPMERQILIPMPEGNYIVWRLLQNPYRFEMEQVESPKTAMYKTDFRELHEAFHELEAKYNTLLRCVSDDD